MKTSPIEFGEVSIEVPAHCPDPATFRSVVAEELQRSFGQDTVAAASCKAEYDRCRKASASSFAPMSSAAQKWARFEHGTTDRFSDYCLDDGSSQTPAIPGWKLESLQSSVRERPRQSAKAQDATERTGRLDQMKVKEPSVGRSWRDRRPAEQDAGKDNGRGRQR